MEQTTKLTNILRDYPNTIISLRAADLSLFARQLVVEVRQEFERDLEVKSKEATGDINLFTAEEVKQILGISDSTLYRLGKSELLVPIWVGGQRRYTYDSLNRFLERR